MLNSGASRLTAHHPRGHDIGRKLALLGGKASLLRHGQSVRLTHNEGGGHATDFDSPNMLAALLVSASDPADAGGWATVHRYVHKSGKCGAAREVLAAQYSIGTKTASGESFNWHDLTAASHEYVLGTITAMNPTSGRSCTVRINDRGPYGMARQMGVKIDFAIGAARCLGMHSTQYICAP